VANAVVVIGAGHAGLAMSRRLAERSIDHVVLERGEVANSWRTERWPGLRLLTPNWQARLPGQGYEGPDPDGFLPVCGVVDLLADYAVRVDAPVHAGVTVTSVAPATDGFTVATDQGAWQARSVVLATGACNVATVPAAAEGVPPDVRSVTPMTYRGPHELPDAGVLVVGAAATGCQLAQEIQASGRPVTLSVGEHVRLPRAHRGRDIFWWLEAAGILDERHDEVDDLVRARHLPSPQLVGSPERADLDLNALQRGGVRVVGRLGGIVDGVAQFSGSLTNVCALADLKLRRLLRRLDEWAEATGVAAELGESEPVEPTEVPSPPLLDLDLRSGEVGSVVWATGYRPDHSWLDVPVLDRRGRIRHQGGVVEDAPGLYVIGMPLLRRRASTYIHGSVDDSAALADHLHAQLASSSR
jgi:putative flavoprotein involved in K+ transport